MIVAACFLSPVVSFRGNAALETSQRRVSPTLVLAGLLVFAFGCKTPKPAKDEPLQVADTPHPVCDRLTDDDTQWPDTDELEPVRVEPAGPIACIDGEAVPFDGLQTLSDVVLPFETTKFVVEKLAAARVDGFLMDRALERTGAETEVSEDELANAVKRFRLGFEDDAALDVYLEQATEKPLDEWLHRRVRIQKLIEHRNDEAPVASRAQARSYYETHLEEFTEPKRYELVYVMFPTPEDSDQLQVEEVRTRAQRFADAARSDGADFESLADEATVHGARTIDSPVENLSVVLAKAVEKATPGEVVGPLESDYGYYVMRLDEVHPASTVPFEQVDDQLVGRLSREKYEVSLGELRNELRASSEIVMLWGNVRVEVAE